MTSKEISKIMDKMLHHENWHDKNSKERKLYEEMCLRSMFMTCLRCEINIFTKDSILKYHRIFGRDRFLEIFKEQQKDFKPKHKNYYMIGIDVGEIIYKSLLEVK